MGNPTELKGTKIVGEIQSNSDFRIDGTLEGSISTSGKVVIGKDGNINGKVVCSNADFEGNFSGNLEVKETLTLKSSSKTEGDVIISKLIVDAGAFFNARCSMKSSSDVKSISDNREKIA